MKKCKKALKKILEYYENLSEEEKIIFSDNLKDYKAILIKAIKAKSISLCELEVLNRALLNYEGPAKYRKKIQYVIDKRLKMPYYLYDSEEYILNKDDDTTETGDANYIASEYIRDGLIYHFRVKGSVDHEHSFSGVIDDILLASMSTSDINIFGFEDEYSKQEKIMLNKLLEKIKLDRSKINTINF